MLVAGLIPVLLFAIGSLLPGAEASAMLGYFPEVPWLDSAQTWLYSRRIHWAPSAGLIFAVAGIGVMSLGATLARRQRPVLDALQARKRDARRRRVQYGPAERIEPTLF